MKRKEKTVAEIAVDAITEEAVLMRTFSLKGKEPPQIRAKR